MLPYRCVSPQCAMPLCQSYTRFDACPVNCLRCMSPCSTPVLLLSLLSPGSRPVSAGSLCCKLVLALPDFKPTQATSIACRQSQRAGCVNCRPRGMDQHLSLVRGHRSCAWGLLAAYCQHLALHAQMGTARAGPVVLHLAEAPRQATHPSPWVQPWTHCGRCSVGQLALIEAELAATFCMPSHQCSCYLKLYEGPVIHDFTIFSRPLFSFPVRVHRLHGVPSRDEGLHAPAYACAGPPGVRRHCEVRTGMGG